MPFDALLQRPRHFELAVGAGLDAAVFHRRNLLGEHRDVLVLVVADNQAFDHAQFNISQELAGKSVEVVDFRGVADAQRAAASRTGLGGLCLDGFGGRGGGGRGHLGGRGRRGARRRRARRGAAGGDQDGAGENNGEAFEQMLDTHRDSSLKEITSACLSS